MKTIYTNLSPVNHAYTNINHLFHLKKHGPQKLYICIWDSYVYENPLFEKGLGTKLNKTEKLYENVKFIEKILTYLEIDYKIIYISEAIKRLFKNSEYFAEFQNIVSNIKVGDMIMGIKKFYTPFGDISVSRLNYIISDYLIAIHLPELSENAPTHYLTSERFRVFQDIIKSSLTKSKGRHFPETLLVTNVPVIRHPEENIIPTLEMSFESIKRIVKSHYKKRPSQKEILDISEVLFSVQSRLIHKNSKFSKNKINSLFEKFTYKEFIDFVSLNMYNYFKEINKITQNVSLKKDKKSMFISSYDDFSRVKALNNIKLEVLKHCNGHNSSLDISKITGLKLSTVSTYLGHLKVKKMIDPSRRPVRLVDSFVIDLEVMQK